MAQNIENASHGDCWRCTTHGPEAGFGKRSHHELCWWRNVKILDFDQRDSTIIVEFKEEFEKYKLLRKQLNKVYKKQHIPGVHPVVGQPCAGQLSDGSWVRGTLCEVNEDWATIQDVDDCNRRVFVEKNGLKFLQAQHLEPPGKNVMCKLAKENLKHQVKLGGNASIKFTSEGEHDMPVGEMPVVYKIQLKDRK